MRTTAEIQAEVQQIVARHGNLRLQFAQEERKVLDRLAAIEAELGEAQAAEAAKAPKALLARIEQLEAAAKKTAAKKKEATP